MIIGVGAVAWFAYDLPDVRDIATVSRRPSVTIETADGVLLASRGDLYGQVVQVRDLPPHVPQAVLAVEDRRFYSHFGIDLIGVARAAVTNLRAGRVVQGGSTITQQAAKNLFLTPERSLKRKIQEVLLALWLEQRFTKDQILTLYLNRVYLGAGTYGIDAAAQRYFGRSARDITVYQAAVLAGLLKAPSRYNPHTNPDGANGRAAVVLNGMVAAGFLRPEDAAAARSAGGKAVASARRSGVGRHFADWILDTLDGYVGAHQGDLVVRTTLDLGLQEQAEKALAKALAEEGPKRGVAEGAVVVMAPDGAVRAMVGGRDYGTSQFNRAAQAMRQPGSAFKPFVYLAALEQGMAPDDRVVDSPIRVDGWSPANFEGKYQGTVTLREAVARSSNVVAVDVQERVGRATVIRTARRLGLLTDMEPAPSLALGALETTLLQLTGSYAPFANGGEGVIPHGVLEIRTRGGEILYRRVGEGLGRVVDPVAAARMNDLLSAVIEWGTGKGAAIGRPAAGKTGTSSNHRDAWFIGYTPDYIAGVWVGNDDNSAMKQVTGGGLPARIWRDVMTAAHKGLPPKPLPRRQEGDPLTRFFHSIFGDGSAGAQPHETFRGN